jgi:hypothetical protein
MVDGGSEGNRVNNVWLDDGKEFLFCVVVTGMSYR